MRLKIRKKENNFAFASILLFMLFLICLAFSSRIVGAEFLKGNQTAEIQAEYSPYATIKGWINLSFRNESANSQLSTNFGESISLISMLEKNNLSQTVNCSNLLCDSNDKYAKIQLEPAGFRVPSAYGNYTLRIYLADTEIASQQITVSKIPIIKSVSPTIAPAAAMIDFVADAYSPENLSLAEYTWDFGDGSSVKTTTNKTSHIYPEQIQHSSGVMQ